MSEHIGEGVKAVLFDHDDTLVDTLGPKGDQHKHIARAFYGKELTDEQIREHWGKPLTTLVGLLYETDDTDLALERLRAVYDEFPKILYPNTLSVLRHMRERGKKLGVVTATGRFNLDADFRQLGIPPELFDYTQTEEDTSYHKPDPRAFEPAVRWLGGLSITPNETVYIGDGLQDMEAALGAGFRFVGVGTGLIPPEEFRNRGAPAVNDLGELLPPAV